MITTWEALPRNEKGLVKLADKGHSLLSLLRLFQEHDTRYVRYVTQAQMDELTKPGFFQHLSPYILMPLFEDSASKKPVTMVFSNHGQVHFCKGECLSDYRFLRPEFYWNFSLKTLENLPKESRFAQSYCLSSDEDAYQEWEASFYFEEIFDYYGLNGADEMAPFVAFFFIKD